ncbi:ABC transporter ATP-binding protein [Candidatus Babeliales bacterium]|nr:ABC transporter ATP-binding protein [Candidatus Babeliales bacterium]
MSQDFLRLHNLKKYYYANGRVTKALDGVSFSIGAGEIMSLLGVNGAGKTTLSALLITLTRPTDGDITCNGVSIYKDIPAFRKLVGFCPQKPNLNEDLTIEQLLWFSGKYYGLPEARLKERMEHLLDAYSLQPYRTSKPDVLSGGYARRVLIARALIHDPKLLVLDEPTVGLDPHIRHQLWENIRDLKKQGVSVLLTTHYLDEADVLSDRVCILDKGKLKLIDTPSNLKAMHNKSTLESLFITLMNEEPKD